MGRWHRRSERLGCAILDAVLGLSIASRTVGWVLIDATSGASDDMRDTTGAKLAGEELSVTGYGGLDAGSISAHAMAIVSRLQPILTAGDPRIRGVGVTWGADAVAAAALVMDILADAGFDNVIAVRPHPADRSSSAQTTDMPAGAHLMAAREAALNSVACVQFGHPQPDDVPTNLDAALRSAPIRSQRLSYAGARAALAAGALTFVVSLSAVLSPHLGPAEDVQPTHRVASAPTTPEAPLPAPEAPSEPPVAAVPLGALWEADEAPALPPVVAPQPSGHRSLLSRVREHMPHLPGR